MKPMSTAPRDGTRIVAVEFVRSYYKPIAIVYYWKTIDGEQWYYDSTNEKCEIQLIGWLCTRDEAKEILERECQP